MTAVGHAAGGRAGPGRGDRRAPAPPLRAAGGGGGAAPASRADPGGERLSAVALVGVTASGKSEAALALARRRGDCEIVSVDSMCVYRGMDIGTSKPGAEARAAVPHHLLDLVDPDEDFTLTQFQAAARAALAGIARRGRHALLVGRHGSLPACRRRRPRDPGALPRGGGGARGRAGRGPGRAGRLHARLAALDPVGAARMEPGNRRRVVRALEVTLGSGRPFSTFGPGLEAYPESGTAQVGLARRPRRSTPASRRASTHMVESGLVEEVRALAARPAGLSRTARQALGYREILAHVEDGRPPGRVPGGGARRTRQFARRQASWFRATPGYRGPTSSRGGPGPGRETPSACTAEPPRLREWWDAGHQARGRRQRLPGRPRPRGRHPGSRWPRSASWPIGVGGSGPTASSGSARPRRRRPLHGIAQRRRRARPK